jgi:hypothetical protein
MAMDTPTISRGISHPQSFESTSTNGPYLTTLTFGRRLYRLESIEPNWYQRSPDDAVECSCCGEIISFCFANRTGEPKAGFAFPIAARCGCFLANNESTTLSSYLQRLARQPIPITAAKEHELHGEFARPNFPNLQNI